MANKHKDIDKDALVQLAYEYCDDCIEKTKKYVAGSRKVVNVEDRKLPTIAYFLHHWLRRKDFDFYKRSNFYSAKKDENHPLSDTIKYIDDLFKQLAVDIVANEGKGIFYAKNRLGMHDKQHIEQKSVDKFDFDGNDD